MTKTIAITGGIGSGKSTFCSKLKEKGFKIHSSDEQVAKIYKNPEKKFVTYLRTIGLSKSISKKNIDKKIISKIIFENKQIRKKLELYIFKIVRKKRSDFIKKEKQSFLTSGSKKIKDKINLTENPEIFIWGVVTYVIHAL